ncbi:hypothetical protein AXG93_4368s2320 [Marchantia polymorpha subsp. ruderalis]|uniref:Uncharacterized protein n=1 Tax=Marchantia polymorpha subsp. ruderalis TaxID=1480154 RepID=A0A176VZX3_MARPO|nr:hypothetical protein AXG93_4368s2320 [Marchantia polymorpha subsp. ruderalis]
MASTSVVLRGLSLYGQTPHNTKSRGFMQRLVRCSNRVEFGSITLIGDKLWRGHIVEFKGRSIVFGRKQRGFLTRMAAEDNFEASSVAVEEQQQLSSEEELDREDVTEILRVVELLRKKRDMTFNEVRLTIMIEDPRDVERRKQLGIEDDRGCSREDLGAALMEVYEGRIPQDRVVLRELAKEMLQWPNLEDEIAADRLPPVASPYAKVTNTGVDPRVAAERAKVDWDTAADITPGEEKKDLGESLPPVVVHILTRLTPWTLISFLV